MLHWKRFVVTALACMMCGAATAPPPPPPALRLELFQSGGGLDSRQFACSREEQRCLRRGMLLHAPDGRCYRAGERGPCPEGVLFHADRAEAERTGGHLRGTCERTCAQPGQAPLAIDGSCMARAQVDEQVCRAELHVRAALDVFGEWVCEWTLLPCAPPKPFYLGADASPDDGYYNGVCSAAQLVATKPLNVTVPPEMPADHPLAKYFLNRSLLHGEFPCTEEEKLCLQYGRVLARDGKCYSPNDFSKLCEPNQSIHVDLEEATKEGGKLQLTCRSACKDTNQVKIATGECVTHSSVYNNICKYDWGMQSQRDPFGRVGCVCATNPESAEMPSPQPPPAASAAGLCRAPDLDNPVRAPNFDETLSLGAAAACSAEQLACFAGGLVLAPAPLTGCHALRTRGPCAEGEQLLLDKEALAQARFQAKCGRADGCAAGSVRMPGDGRCLAIQQAEKVMCVNSHLALDEFGGWQCNWEAAFPGGNLSCIARDESSGTCTLPPSQGHRGAWSPGAPGVARPQAHYL